jgi:predicted nucleotide-binding protein
MAKRSTPGPGPSRRLSTEEKRSALTRLESRVDELTKLDISNIRRGDDPPVQSLSQLIESTLASIYGQDSAEYRRLSTAADLDATVYVLNFDGRETPPHEIQKGVRRGIDRAVAVLRGEAGSLREDLQFAAAPTASPATIATPTPSDEVFIVHGRDSPAKLEVARLIQKAGLRDVILHEQPNQGRTIIEKFEAHGGAAGFAVIVATADDVGGPDPGHLQPRARQNVIGEMFWFAGRLSRERVCVLVKGAIEMPSDFAGIGYTEMDDRGAWKAELLRELQAAGYANLDWGKALA